MTVCLSFGLWIVFLFFNNIRIKCNCQAEKDFKKKTLARPGNACWEAETGES